MKVAIVVPHFGRHVVGASEKMCYYLVKQLRDRLGWDIHIYTTSALSSDTWGHFFPIGEEDSDVGLIKRFRVVAKKNRYVFVFFDKLLKAIHLIFPAQLRKRLPSLATEVIKLFENMWMLAQGPWVPKLVDDLSKNATSYERIYFFSLQHYTTISCLKRIKKNVLLVPLIQDESKLDFVILSEQLSRKYPCIVRSETEKSMLAMAMDNLPNQFVVAGYGLEAKYFRDVRPDLEVFKHLVRQPYMLYVGSIGDSRGISSLIRFFLEYLEYEKDHRVQLVLVGENDGTTDFVYHPQLRYIGYVSESDLVELVSNSLCVVDPSPNEDISMLALKAVALMKPALVNGRSEVLRSLADKLNTVHSYFNLRDFCVKLGYLAQESPSKSLDSDLKSGRAWVESSYSWPVVLEKYDHTNPRRI